MAENKVSLEIEVQGAEKSINSFKELKTALKAAKDEQIKAAEQFGIGSKEYEQASKSVSNLKDKVEDLNDSSKSLAGSGLERAKSGFSQLGEGLRNLDFDKVKVGLTAIKSALAATGIMLLVQGVTYLIENFDELSKGSGLLAKVLQFVGTVVNGLKEALTDLADKMGIVNKELDKMSENLKKYGDTVTETLGKQNSEYDRHINLLKAQGKEAAWLEKLKQENIIRTNKALVEQIQAYAAAGGVINEEQKKLLSSALENIKNAVNQKEIIQATADKKRIDENQKANEKELSNYKKLQEDKQKAEQDAWNNTVEIRIANNEAARQDDERLRKEAEEQKAQDLQKQFDYINEQNANEQFATTQTYDFKKAKRDADLEDFKHNQDSQITATKAALQSTQILTDLFFDYKLKKHKGDAKAENEIRKKQFQVNKAFGVANSIVDGISAVAKALNNPYPLNIILAVAAGIAATANTLKIASAKFEPDSGGGSSGGGAAQSIPVPSPPTINTPNANTNNVTTFDESGKKITADGERLAQPTINIKATVGVDEITDKSNRVQVLEKQSTF